MGNLSFETDLLGREIRIFAEGGTLPTPPSSSNTLPQQSTSGIPAGFETPTASAASSPGTSIKTILEYVAVGFLVVIVIRALSGKKGK